MSRAHALKNLAGQRFGHLVVIRRAGKEHRGYATWHCLCDCGEKIICVGHLLRAGKRKACARNGHRWTQRTVQGLTAKHPNEYSSFRSMHERCKNKRSKSYKNYGGRGIKVCARWKAFQNFIDDMGPRPSLFHTLERRGNNGNYEPDNCCWATMDEQRRNMRCNVYVMHEGERVLLMDVVAELGLSRGHVYGRLKNGWSLEEALTVPVKSYKKG